MVVPNYTSLKLKMLGPYGIITIGGNLQQAHLYKQENYDIATAACQPLEPRLTWATVTGVVPESSVERQPMGARPEHDFPMW